MINHPLRNEAIDLINKAFDRLNEDYNEANFVDSFKSAITLSGTLSSLAGIANVRSSTFYQCFNGGGLKINGLLSMLSIYGLTISISDSKKSLKVDVESLFNIISTKVKKPSFKTLVELLKSLNLKASVEKIQKQSDILISDDPENDNPKNIALASGWF